MERLYRSGAGPRKVLKGAGKISLLEGGVLRCAADSRRAPSGRCCYLPRATAIAALRASSEPLLVEPLLGASNGVVL